MMMMTMMMINSWDSDYINDTVCLCMTTLTEVFLCFFLSCKTNPRVKPARWGKARTLPMLSCCSMYFCVVLCIVCFVTFPVLFVCICVLNNCHRVATQLQLNISYHIISYIRRSQDSGVLGRDPASRHFHATQSTGSITRPLDL
jgi:hypothetical protein